MATALQSILEGLRNVEFILFRKSDVQAFLKREALTLADKALAALYDDLFAFNAYLGRIEPYDAIENLPFWEYSVCLEWCESHMMFGGIFDLTLENAKRFLGNIRRYFDFLVSTGKLDDTSQIDKAIKHICSGKKLKLVTKIPYTGKESYTSLVIGKETISFSMSDYWILVLHASLFDDSWTTLLEAAFGLSKERVQQVKDLKAKMGRAGMAGVRDIIYQDVSRADLEQARKWFYATST